MIAVLRRVQQSFSHITTMTACCWLIDWLIWVLRYCDTNMSYSTDACCMSRDSARILSTANTNASCRKHKTRIDHPVTLFWYRANESWFYRFNAERLSTRPRSRFLKKDSSMIRYAHSEAHTRPHAHIHTRIHAHTYAHVQTYDRTHTNTHMQTLRHHLLDW